MNFLQGYERHPTSLPHYPALEFTVFPRAEGTVNEQRELIKQYQLAMMHLTDQVRLSVLRVGVRRF